MIIDTHNKYATSTPNLSWDLIENAQGELYAWVVYRTKRLDI